MNCHIGYPGWPTKGIVSFCPAAFPWDGTVLAEPAGRALASGLDKACRLELRS